MKIFKTIAKWTLIIGLSAILLGVAAVFVFKDDIQKAGIKAINEEINVPFKVSDYKVSLWKTFPNLSFTVYDLEIEESSPIYKQPLLEAKEVHLVFNIWHVMQGKYEVSKLKCQTVHARVGDSKKNHNYDILKSSESEDSSNFNLEDILCEGIQLEYMDMESQLYISTFFNELSAGIAISPKNMAIETTGAGKIIQYSTQKDTLMQDKSIELSTVFDVNQIVDFKEIDLQLEQAQITGKGSVNHLEKDKSISFQLKTEDLSIAQLLPWISSSSFNSKIYQTKGVINANCNIGGSTENLNGKIDFSLKQGSLKHREYDVSLQNISTKGVIKFGEKEQVNVPTLTATLDNEPIQLSFNLKDYSNPFIQCQANGKLNLEKVGKLANLEQNLTGFAAVDVQYQGLVSQLQNTSKADRWKGQGVIKLENFGIQNRGDSMILSQVNGTLSVKENKLQIPQLNGYISNSKFNFRGSVNSIASYLFTESNNIDISGVFSTPYLDYDRIAYVMEDKNQKSSTQTAFRLPKDVSLNLRYDIKSFKQGKFKGTNLNGTVLLKNKLLQLSQVSIGFQGGTLQGDISIRQSNDGNFIPTGYFNCKNVPLKPLFYSFDNFDQQEITDKHLSGNLNAQMSIAGVWDQYLNCDFQSLFAQIDLNINNGRIKNYEPLLALSKFVKVKELMDIQFEPISQSIEIKDNWMYLSPIELKNNVVNLSILEAKHSLDNEMDYRLKLIINQLLSNKYSLRKNRDPELYTNTSNGGMSLFIHMFTQGDELMFKYDRKNVKAKIKEEVKKEKQELKAILRKEFGLKKKDSVATKPKHVDVEWDE